MQASQPRRTPAQARRREVGVAPWLSQGRQTEKGSELLGCWDPGPHGDGPLPRASDAAGRHAGKAASEARPSCNRWRRSRTLALLHCHRQPD